MRYYQDSRSSQNTNSRQEYNRRDFLKTGAKLLGSVAALSTGLANTLLASPEKSTMEYVKLNNGVKMPILGYGTYSIKDVQTLLQAIDVGYRLFDSAQMYRNEKEVGTAIREAITSRGIKREEFFITTKLSSNMSFNEAKKGIDSSLEALGLEYIDLLLIHDTYSQRKEMYQAMEEAYKDGKLKAIGVSNFNRDVFSDFIKTAKIPPAVNQCETHILRQQSALQAVMKPYGTILESWSPFVKGQSGFFDNPTLSQIAKAYNKSVAQIALRFLIQQGIIVIPKASKLHHMQENIAVFDFTLSKADMKTIQSLDTNKGQFSYSR